MHELVEAPFDAAELIARCEGDVDLAKQLVEVFQHERPRMFEDLRGSVTAGDPASTARAAHTLKGSVGVFGDVGTHDSASALERMGRDDNLAGAAGELARLEIEIARLERDLTRFVNQTGTP